MKAMSIMQPWLFAICRMGKRIENRTWAPTPTLIGQRIALHASKSEDDLAMLLPWPSEYTFGQGAATQSAIVATAKLVGVVRTRDEARAIGQDRWWVDHPRNLAHVFEDVLELPEPIRDVRGALSHWPLSEAVAAAVLEQERRARQ